MLVVVTVSTEPDRRPIARPLQVISHGPDPRRCSGSGDRYLRHVATVDSRDAFSDDFHPGNELITAVVNLALRGHLGLELIAIEHQVLLSKHELEILREDFRPQIPVLSVKVAKISSF